MEHSGEPAYPGQPNRVPVDDSRWRERLPLIRYEAHFDQLSDLKSQILSEFQCVVFSDHLSEEAKDMLRNPVHIRAKQMRQLSFRVVFRLATNFWQRSVLHFLTTVMIIFYKINIYVYSKYRTFNITASVAVV